MIPIVECQVLRQASKPGQPELIEKLPGAMEYFGEAVYRLMGKKTITYPSVANTPTQGLHWGEFHGILIPYYSHRQYDVSRYRQHQT